MQKGAWVQNYQENDGLRPEWVVFGLFFMQAAAAHQNVAPLFCGDNIPVKDKRTNFRTAVLSLSLNNKGDFIPI